MMALVETTFLVLLGALPAQESGLDPRPYQPFFRRYCSDCHLEGTAKGGLDLAEEGLPLVPNRIRDTAKFLQASDSSICVAQD